MILIDSYIWLNIREKSDEKYQSVDFSVATKLLLLFVISCRHGNNWVDRFVIVVIVVIVVIALSPALAYSSWRPSRASIYP